MKRYSHVNPNTALCHNSHTSLFSQSDLN